VRDAGQEEEHDWRMSKARANVFSSQLIDLFIKVYDGVVA
jgi:hypothetical protein